MDLAKRLSQQWNYPLIEESPDLLALPSRSRDAGNTILGKRFPRRPADPDRREFRRGPAIDARALADQTEI